MASADTLGVMLIPAILLAVMGCVLYSRLPGTIKVLICAALVLRVVGALTRYMVLTEVYGGVGDASGYFGRGVVYAASFGRLDFSPLTDAAGWWNGKWWGTQFVHFVSAIAVGITGPSMPAAFIVFSLLCFVGLVGFAIAFSRSYPAGDAASYLRWIWLFPSLWFWPSSLGKEALILLGIGVAWLGYAGGGTRIRWSLVAFGTFLIFSVRPQVAAVLLFSLMLGHWLAAGGGWTAGRLLRGTLLFAIGGIGIALAMSSVGIESFDAEGVQSYMESDPARRVGGGSSIDAVEIGIVGVPIALGNILFRPFPWEARNPMMVFSALEILAVWFIIWRRRGRLWENLGRWRQDRIIAAALVFITVYSVTLGFMVTNLGIIARQRVFFFPFLFLLIQALPRSSDTRMQRTGEPRAADPLLPRQPAGVRV
jgi:hypothetical protein